MVHAERQLVFDSKPSNFRSRFGSMAVTGDIYHIADRMRELSPRLLLTDRAGDGWPEDGGFRYVVSELCDDGVERWVMGIQHGELDQRQITKLEEMLRVPFNKRFKRAEAEEARRNAAIEEAELDRLAEEVGLPMQRDLEQCGFVSRAMKYSKRGVMGPKRGAGLPLPPKKLILPGE